MGEVQGRRQSIRTAERIKHGAALKRGPAQLTALKCAKTGEQFAFGVRPGRIELAAMVLPHRRFFQGGKRAARQPGHSRQETGGVVSLTRSGNVVRSSNDAGSIYRDLRL